MRAATITDAARRDMWARFSPRKDVAKRADADAKPNTTAASGYKYTAPAVAIERVTAALNAFAKPVSECDLTTSPTSTRYNGVDASCDQALMSKIYWLKKPMANAVA